MCCKRFCCCCFIYNVAASSNSSSSSSETGERGECMLRSSGSVCSGSAVCICMICCGILITRRISFDFRLRFSAPLPPPPNIMSWLSSVKPNGNDLMLWLCNNDLPNSIDSSLASDLWSLSDIDGLMAGVGGLEMPHLWWTKWWRLR